MDESCQMAEMEWNEWKGNEIKKGLKCEISIYFMHIYLMIWHRK